MKITFAASDIEPALQLVSTGLLEKSGDISGHFVFRVKDDEVEVLAYNGRLGASSSFLTESVDTNGTTSFTVEGWRLKQWIAAAGDVSLTLTEKSGKVTIMSPRSKGTFRSLDPGAFAFWDDMISDSTKVTTISAKRLREALANVKNFVHEKDTQNPEYAQCQAREGHILCSDRTALSIHVVQGLGDSDLRIHGKDIPSVISFLQSAGDNSVDLLEHDHALFLLRKHDDVKEVLTVGRPNSKFPKIGYDVSEEACVAWVLDVKELSTGIKQLTASAEKGDKKLRFTLNDEDQVIMSMKSTEGTEDKLPMETSGVIRNDELHRKLIGDAIRKMKRVEIEKKPKEERDVFVEQLVSKYAKSTIKKVTDSGFALDCKQVQRLLSQYSGSEIRFQVQPLPGGGFVQIKDDRDNAEEKDGDSDFFVTMLAFLRE